jgi:hypothetical protein
MSDSTASGSPETLLLPRNPLTVTPLSNEDYEWLKELHSALWRDPNVSCLTCNKKGTFRTRVQGEEVMMRCDCVEQWGLHLWLLNAGIGLGYQRLGWDHIATIPDSVQESVLMYLEHGRAYAEVGHGLTLWSPSRGTGKTLLATLILRNLMATGVDGFFCLFNKLLTLHTAGWRDDKARKWFERRIMNAEVLVIDDAGKENPNRSEMVSAVVDEILRTRIDNARPTILTSNLSQEEMGERYLSDVVELFSGCNQSIEVTGTSYRPRFEAEMRENARRGLKFPVVIG